MLGRNEVMILSHSTLLIRNVQTHQHQVWMEIAPREDQYKLCTAVVHNDLYILHSKCLRKFDLNQRHPGKVHIQQLTNAQIIQDIPRNPWMGSIDGILHIMMIDKQHERGSTPVLYSIENGTYKKRRTFQALDHNLNEYSRYKIFGIPSQRAFLIIFTYYGTTCWALYSMDSGKMQSAEMALPRLYVQSDSWHCDLPSVLTWNEDFLITFKAHREIVGRYSRNYNRPNKYLIYILELATMDLYVSTVRWRPQIGAPKNGLAINAKGAPKIVIMNDFGDGKLTNLIVSHWVQQTGIAVAVPDDIIHLINTMCSREYLHLFQGQNGSKNHCRIPVEDILRNKRLMIFIGECYKLKGHGSIVRVEAYIKRENRWEVSLKADSNKRFRVKIRSLQPCSSAS